MIFNLVDLKTNSFKTSVRMERAKVRAENRKLRREGKFERWLSSNFTREVRFVICRELTAHQNALNGKK